MLPDNLIPYYPYTIDTLLFIIQQILLNITQSNDDPSELKPIDKALESIDKVIPEELLLSERMLNHCLNIFHQTRLKLILFFRKNKNNNFSDLEDRTEIDLLHIIMEFSLPGIPDIKSNACKLSLYYYFQEGSYMKNAYFLFGTAHQFRK